MARGTSRAFSAASRVRDRGVCLTNRTRRRARYPFPTSHSLSGMA